MAYTPPSSYVRADTIGGLQQAQMQLADHFANQARSEQAANERAIVSANEADRFAFSSADAADRAEALMSRQDRGFYADQATAAAGVQERDRATKQALVFSTNEDKRSDARLKLAQDESKTRELQRIQDLDLIDKRSQNIATAYGNADTLFTQSLTALTSANRRLMAVSQLAAEGEPLIMRNKEGEYVPKTEHGSSLDEARQRAKLYNDRTLSTTSAVTLATMKANELKAHRDKLAAQAANNDLVQDGEAFKNPKGTRFLFTPVLPPAPAAGSSAATVRLPGPSISMDARGGVWVLVRGADGGTVRRPASPQEAADFRAAQARPPAP